jgi:hypothetical protein
MEARDKWLIKIVQASPTSQSDMRVIGPITQFEPIRVKPSKAVIGSIDVSSPITTS